MFMIQLVDQQEWVYPESLKVKIAKVESKEVIADAVISLIETEVLMSDKLAGELEIVVEDFGKGLWRLRKESIGTIHETEKPQTWL